MHAVQVRVVILGQDPYINAGEAMGLSFSVPPGVRTPPSLANMYRELAADLGCSTPNHGCLEKVRVHEHVCDATEGFLGGSYRVDCASCNTDLLPLLLLLFYWVF